MRKNVAILLFVLVLLVICMIASGILDQANDWVYSNQVNDKIAHFVFGSILAFLVFYIFYPLKLSLGSLKIPLGPLLLLLFFGLEETLQAFIPGRDANPFDLLASWAGLLVGSLLAAWWDRRRPQNHQSEQ